MIHIQAGVRQGRDWEQGAVGEDRRVVPGILGSMVKDCREMEKGGAV